MAECVVGDDDGDMASRLANSEEEEGEQPRYPRRERTQHRPPNVGRARPRQRRDGKGSEGGGNGGGKGGSA